MSVLVDADTRLVVQGITGSEGTFHTLRNVDYGTEVVAGVTPGKGGQDVEGIQVFDTVADAVRETGADTSMIFVPSRFARTRSSKPPSGIRARRVHHRGHTREGHGLRPWVPRRREGRPRLSELPRRDQSRRGERRNHPRRDSRRGPWGWCRAAARSCTRSCHEMTSRGIGQSTCMGNGGDPVHGIGSVEALRLFQRDAGTLVIVMVVRSVATRGARGGVRGGRGHEAGGGLHRWLRGALGQADGRRWCDRDRFDGDRCCQGGGAGGGGCKVARNPTQVAELVEDLLAEASGPSADG